MQPNTIPEIDESLPKSQRFKWKVRDNQEVGRWKKSEHEAFLKGTLLTSITSL